MPKSKIYITATYDGVEHTKKISEWVIFLVGKPVAKRLTYQAIKTRHYNKESGQEITARQLLGIDELKNRKTGVNDKKGMLEINKKIMAVILKKIELTRFMAERTRVVL